MNAPWRLASGAPSLTGAPLIRLADVRKLYAVPGGEAAALDGLTLDIPKGTIVAIIGPSGAGKSTLARLAAGLEAPTSGSVVITGVAGGPAGFAAVAAIAEHPHASCAQTVGEALAKARARAGEPRDDARAADALLLLDLDHLRDRNVAALSGGERRKLAIAEALAGDPVALVADNPTGGLDPESARQVSALLARLNGELGLTILLATHNMALVDAIAHRAVVLDRGRIVEDGAPHELFAHPKHLVTRGFAASAPGATLPAFLSAKLSPTPTPRGKALLRLVFDGESATRPVITSVARELGFDLGIVAGALGAEDGEPQGVLIVATPSDEPYYTAAVERFEDAGLGVDPLGFVP